MEQAELKGAMERFLDMHMYITSALQRADMKAVGLQLALDLLHQKVSRGSRMGHRRFSDLRLNYSKLAPSKLAQQYVSPGMIPFFLTR